jgi:O-glycosyl hydrolase
VGSKKVSFSHQKAFTSTKANVKIASVKNKLLQSLLWIVPAILLLGCSKETITSEPEQTVENSIPVTINAATSLQIIRGFGGAAIHNWIADLTSTQMTKAFSATDGIGLSIMRVRIPSSSSDFSGEVSQINAAKQFGVSIIATAWSAPATMKTSNNVVGGKLKPESYAAYAAYLRSYNAAVGGVTTISPWNEPNYVVTYEGMNNNAAEIGDFIRVYADSCGTKVIAPETFNMKQSFNDSVISIAGAKLNTICGHIYGVSPYNYSVGKEIWMTEHITTTDSANIWNGAMALAKEIHDCMAVNYNIYVWWYIRRFYGLIDENSNITKRGYVMAHFARWVRPGYYRIACTANPTSGVYCTAYTNGSKLVVVAINQNANALNFCFNYSGLSISGFTGYSTNSTSNLSSKNLSNTGNAVLYALPASSITTLVSN